MVLLLVLVLSLVGQILNRKLCRISIISRVLFKASLPSSNDEFVKHIIGTYSLALCTIKCPSQEQIREGQAQHESNQYRGGGEHLRTIYILAQFFLSSCEGLNGNCFPVFTCLILTTRVSTDPQVKGFNPTGLPLFQMLISNRDILHFWLIGYK